MTIKISVRILLLLLLLPEISVAQDKILLKNDSLITAVVVSSDNTFIYFKQPDNSVKGIALSHIKRIFYENGSFEDFELKGGELIKVIGINPGMTATGYLSNVSDSAIEIKILSDSSLNYETKVMLASEIKAIHVKKVRVLRNSFIGLGIGFLTGAIVGFISGDDPPCSPGSWICIRYTAGQKAMGAGLLLGAGGFLGTAIVGGIINSSSKIRINGEVSRLQKNKLRLNKYVLKKAEV